MSTIYIPNFSMLIAVDVQYDFVDPHGALYVPGAEKIIPGIVDTVRKFGELGHLTGYSYDYHPRDHCSFKANGGQWPEHCVMGTVGATLYPQFLEAVLRDYDYASFGAAKGRDSNVEQYSAFDGSGGAIGKQCSHRGIRTVFICGVALDYCVKATALDALKRGYETYVLTSLTKPVTEETGEQAKDELVRAGAYLIPDGTEIK